MMTGDGLVRRVVDVVTRITPWLAPIPTAWLVGERSWRHLGWPVPVAAIAGIILELLGMGIFETTLDLYNYNRDKRKSDPKAAMWLPVILVVLYLGTAEALTWVLDVWPSTAMFAPAIFPVLSGAAFALRALRVTHQRRLDAIKMQKAELRMQRERNKAQRMQHERQAEVAAMQEVQRMSKAAQVRRLAELHPEWTNAMLAAEVGCHPGTVTRALRNGSKAPEELVEVGDPVSGIGYR